MNIEKVIKTSKKLPLSKQVVTNIIYSGNLVSLKLNKVLKTYYITLQQFNVLRILRGQNGNCLNLSEIQERMINTNSNTTRLIDKLVLKKFVDRKVDTENRRKLSICITKNGLGLLEQLDTVIDQKEEENIVSNLTKEECVILNTLLEKIRA